MDNSYGFYASVAGKLMCFATVDEYEDYINEF